MEFTREEEWELRDEKNKVWKWLDRKLEKGLAKGTISQEEAKFVSKIFEKMADDKYDEFWLDHAHEKATEVIYKVFEECDDEIEYDLIVRIEEA